MKIKRIIAREWLIFLVCVFIGTASYILDDYLVWKKKLDCMKKLSAKELLTSEEYLELKELRKIYEPYTYNYTGIPKIETTAPEKLDRLKIRGYKFGKGYSKHGYFLFLPYFLSLFIRSIVWSITQLRGKL